MFLTSTGLPDLLVAWLPIILPLTFLVILRFPAKKGMTISAIIVAIFALIHWGMQESTIFAAVLKGTWQAGTILLILLGALTLLNTLKLTGAVNRINIGFAKLSRDMRIQAIILGFIFVSLLEGAAGFGSPAAVVGPLLLLLGFKPIAAATIALLGDTIAVSFGAVNTPISVGLGELLANNGLNEALIVKAVTMMDLLVASFLPLLIVFVLTQFLTKKEDRSKKDFVQMIPWTLLIGFTYSLTAFGIANIFNDGAFISIFSPLITIAVAVVTIKLGIFIPKEQWRKASGEEAVLEETNMSLLTAWLPYIVVVGLLVITRILPPEVQTSIKTFFDLSFTNIMSSSINSENARPISQSFQVFWNPGVILIIAALVATFAQSKSIKPFKEAIKLGGNQAKKSAVTLVAILSMVAIFSYSDINVNNLPSMPSMIAEKLAVFGEQYFIIAPLISSIGSFIAGSATVSNLTFGDIHYNVANTSSFLNPHIILAQGTSGAAIGNAFCISNVVAASTVVGETGKEGTIIAKVLPVALILVALSAIAGGIILALGLF